jgi:hypothetical protein
MGSEINFNANDVPPQTPFEPVPNGKYRAHIVDSEVKPTKDGRGKYLQLEWEILDGEYKGRKIWDRLNIVNPSETSQKIGQAQLSAVCHATGVLKLGNSGQLHHMTLVLRPYQRAAVDAVFDWVSRYEGTRSSSCRPAAASRRSWARSSPRCSRTRRRRAVSCSRTGRSCCSRTCAPSRPSCRSRWSASTRPASRRRTRLAGHRRRDPVGRARSRTSSARSTSC